MKKITFILPTKDRPETFKKFVDYHEKIFKGINYKILVIDGSKSFIHKKIKKMCKEKKKITLIKQNKKGFMNACFQAIKKVNTEYCTFLYDDDLLSEEVIKVFKQTMNNKFSIGYGIVENLNNYQNVKHNFSKIKFAKFNNEEVLLAYFGENKLGVSLMPVSPICFIFESSFLIKWKKYLIKFCKKSKFRKHFLLERNIGPDLIIYLLQILNNKKIHLAKPFIAKFNEHESSMSYLLGINNLQIGYWLAKKSVLENNLVYRKEISTKVYNFLLVAGIFILLKNLILYLLFRIFFFITEYLN